jgi:hypothetical protein
LSHPWEHLLHIGHPVRWDTWKKKCNGNRIRTCNTISNSLSNTILETDKPLVFVFWNTWPFPNLVTTSNSVGSVISDSDSRALSPRNILLSPDNFCLFFWNGDIWRVGNFTTPGHLPHECMSCTKFPWWCTDPRELSGDPWQTVSTYILEPVLQERHGVLHEEYAVGIWSSGYSTVLSFHVHLLHFYYLRGYTTCIPLVQGKILAYSVLG